MKPTHPSLFDIIVLIKLNKVKGKILHWLSFKFKSYTESYIKIPCRDEIGF